MPTAPSTRASRDSPVLAVPAAIAPAATRVAPCTTAVPRYCDGIAGQLGGVVGPGLALGGVVGPELALSQSLVAWCHPTDTCHPADVTCGTGARGPSPEGPHSARRNDGVTHPGHRRHG